MGRGLLRSRRCTFADGRFSDVCRRGSIFDFPLSIPVAVVWRGRREAEATRQARMYGVEGWFMGWPRDQSRTGRGVGFNAGLGRALKVWVASGVLACGGQSLSSRELRE